MATRSMRSASAVVLALAMSLPVAAGAIDEQRFKADRTEDLLVLCTATADDPLQEEAIHFCHGYLVGAYDYHIAETSGPGLPRMVCIPPGVTQNEGVAGFVKWAKAHPQYMGELPVETFFRFMTETWPCKG